MSTPRELYELNKKYARESRQITEEQSSKYADAPPDESIMDLVKGQEDKLKAMMAATPMTNGEPLYDPSMPYLLYEVTSAIYQRIALGDEPEEVVERMTSYITAREYADQDDFVISLPNMEFYVEEYKRNIALSRQKIEVVEGIVACKRCGSKKTATSSVQTRSSDEAMSTRVRCTQCGKNFTISG